MNTQDNPPQNCSQPELIPAIAELHRDGAHFVLCRWTWSGSKWSAVAFQPRWQLDAPILDAVLAHVRKREPVGLIPCSIGTLGVDVDRGDPQELFSRFPPIASYPTIRDGGAHGFYSDTKRRGNSEWACFSCAGDLRSASGYLALHRAGPVRLAEGLAAGLDRRPPADLFEAAGVAFADGPDGPRVAPAVVFPALERSGPTFGLEKVRKGGRQKALFDAGRFWAYGQPRGGSLAGWLAFVFSRFLALNTFLHEPIARHRVRTTAHAVARYCWECERRSPEPVDRSPEAQRRRGIKSRRVVQWANRDRDRGMVAMSLDGGSQREIARAYGVSRGCVEKVLRRELPGVAS